MANTFELISSVTVGSGGAATIAFSSIPSTYTDLCLKVSARTAYAGGADAYMIFQGGGGTTNYAWVKLQDDSGSISSYGGASQAQLSPWTLSGAYTANTFSNSEFYIPSYAAGYQKNIGGNSVMENNGTGVYITASSGSWNQTSAITEISLSVASGFTQYSTAYLYGVKNA